MDKKARRVEGRTVNCKACSKEFHPWSKRTPPNEYCSHKCAAALLKVDPYPHTCLQCKKIFYTNWKRNRKYCCKNCQFKSMKGKIPVNVTRDRVGFKKGHPEYRTEKSIQKMAKVLADRGHYKKMWKSSRKIMGGPYRSTSIERKVYETLLEKGVIFEKEKLIGGSYFVDVYIPSLNLVVECDGEYWHSLPDRIEKDKRENLFLKENGYNLVRLSESEINDGSYLNKLKKWQI